MLVVERVELILALIPSLRRDDMLDLLFDIL